MNSRQNDRLRQILDENDIQGPTDIAEKLTGRRYISFSQIQTYQQCSLKWAFAYVEKRKPEKGSAALLFGSGVHAVLQRHFEAVLAAEPPPKVDELMKSYDATWDEDAGQLPIQFGKGDTKESLRETARRVIDQFLGGEYAVPAGQILGIEEELRVILSPNLPELLARVDLIELRGDTVLVTDFKTARTLFTMESVEQKSEQLMLYAKAVEKIKEAFDAKVELRFIVITKGKTPKVEAAPVAFDATRLERSTKVAEQVFKSMQSGAVYPNPSPINCATCPYQQACKAWSGPY